MSHILVVLLSMICAVVAAPVSESDDAQAKVISYENTNDGSGNYHYSFETSNGLKKSETGTLVNAGQPDEHIEVKGEFSYLDENGTEHLFEYTADQNGYRILEIPTSLEISTLPTPSIGIFAGQLSPALVATLLG